MSAWKPLPVSFYRRPAETVARDLLGRYLVRRLDGRRLAVRLVEVEAYLGAPDAASHAAGGHRSARVESLYLPGGHAYVYLIYGIHHCLNAVTGDPEVGSAVLLRAGEPVDGEAAMRAHRGFEGGDEGHRVKPGDVAGGPGKLCQALAVDRALDGAALYRGELTIAAGEPVAAEAIAAGPRVGVDYAGEAAGWPLRFAVAGHRHVSRPRL
ncbi:MAG TPA: DNA-3-methyladenine glycosylase [Thermoanaerobaculia bacterium]|nr:DNA-3-methyladenine glycosylase [Thermoanaerobaculia bacterium]